MIFTCIKCKCDFKHEGVSTHIDRYAKDFKDNRILYDMSYEFSCPECSQSLKLKPTLHSSNGSELFFLVKSGDPTMKEIVSSSVQETIKFFGACVLIGIGAYTITNTIRYIGNE
jgi:hypothetical protein